MARNRSVDAVALMRRIRDKMSREIEGMSYEEEKRYLQHRSAIRHPVGLPKHRS